MIEYLHIKNLGPSPEMEVHWASRLNVITGDNGLGKSFLLDLAWWALTRTWANTVAQPSGPKVGEISYQVKGIAGTAPLVHG